MSDTTARFPMAVERGEVCYTASDVLKTSIVIALMIWIIVLIFSTMAKCSNEEDYFTQPEEQFPGGMGALPTIKIPGLNTESNTNDDDKINYNNDLPGTVKPIPTDGTASYAETVAEMGLEKSVISQHNNYAKQREKYTGTASFNPERSDSQDMVPFVGLRRPSYSNNRGESLLDPTARQVPSEIDPRSLSKPVNLSW